MAAGERHVPHTGCPKPTSTRANRREHASHVNTQALPPVMNMPGADETQAKHCTDAAAEGKQNDVMQAKASLSTSRMPL